MLFRWCCKLDTWSRLWPYLLGLGLAILIYVIYGWFGTVIKENRRGLLDGEQVNRSFRWGMCWFIFSEVMFFVRFWSIIFCKNVCYSTLGDVGATTHDVLYPDFKAVWPVLSNPNPAVI